MRRSVLLVPVLLTATACGTDPGERGVSRDAPPAAAVVAPDEQDQRLPARLEELTAELDSAAAGAPDRLLTAEAITDQLMDAPREMDWLATGYDLEARLRQMQAMADGLVARLRRGATLDEVRPEVELLQAAVADLQQQLALEGGGPAPPTLDSLLAQDPLRDARAASLGSVAASSDTADAEADEEEPAAAAPAAEGGPLGNPVTTPPDTTGDGL